MARPTETHSPSPTVTPSATSTGTPTPTPVPPALQVAVATNCREGPGSTFAFLGVLMVGETAEVLAQSTLPDYWYVANPDRPGERCWLWGEFATVEGDTSDLPVFTPAPSPTSSLDFELYLHSFRECGSQTRLVLIVRNTGGKTFMTGQLHVFDVERGVDLFRPAFERHPFAEGPGVCPPGHGNILNPGAGAYIIIPIGNPPAGHVAYASVKLCTEDYLGGDCVDEIIYFTTPE